MREREWEMGERKIHVQTDENFVDVIHLIQPLFDCLPLEENSSTTWEIVQPVNFFQEKFVSTIEMVHTVWSHTRTHAHTYTRAHRVCCSCIVLKIGNTIVYIEEDPPLG